MKSVLGRGLSSLIPTRSPNNNGHVSELAIHEISPNPNQPRKYFDGEKLTDLVVSVREHGVIQPIVVSKIDKGYQIVVGERRWRAAKAAGLFTIPAIVKDLTPQARVAVALVENIQRHDLNALEEAEAFQVLIEGYGITQEYLSRQIGKSRPHITNTLRLLQLPQSVKSLVVEGKISSGHARALLAMDDQTAAVELARRAADGGLSVRQVEELVKRRSTFMPQKRSRIQSLLERKLEKTLGTTVRIYKRRRGGRIEISCKSSEQLKGFIVRLGRLPSYSS